MTAGNEPLEAAGDLPGAKLGAGRALLDCTVPAGLRCSACGYSLRGLSIAARCPECATEVRVSLLGRHLFSRDPRWLNRVALGAAGLAASTALGVVAAVGYFAPWRVGALLVLLHSVPEFAGTWLLTLADPQEECARHRSPAGRARALAGLVVLFDVYFVSAVLFMPGVLPISYPIATIAVSTLLTTAARSASLRAAADLARGLDSPVLIGEAGLWKPLLLLSGILLAALMIAPLVRVELLQSVCVLTIILSFIALVAAWLFICFFFRRLALAIWKERAVALGFRALLAHDGKPPSAFAGRCAAFAQN